MRQTHSHSLSHTFLRHQVTLFAVTWVLLTRPGCHSSPLHTLVRSFSFQRRTSASSSMLYCPQVHSSFVHLFRHTNCRAVAGTLVANLGLCTRCNSTHICLTLLHRRSSGTRAVVVFSTATVTDTVIYWKHRWWRQRYTHWPTRTAALIIPTHQTTITLCIVTRGLPRQGFKAARFSSTAVIA
jgi:hypothetical protein